MPDRLGEIIIFSAAMDAGAHHIARSRAVDVKFFLCQSFTDDVAVGDHADKLIVLANRNGAYVMLTLHFATSVAEVSGLTQSTPLCITSLTFIA